MECKMGKANMQQKYVNIKDNLWMENQMEKENNKPKTIFMKATFTKGIWMVMGS